MPGWRASATQGPSVQARYWLGFGSKASAGALGASNVLVSVSDAMINRHASPWLLARAVIVLSNAVFGNLLDTNSHADTDMFGCRVSELPKPKGRRSPEAASWFIAERGIVVSSTLFIIAFINRLPQKCSALVHDIQHRRCPDLLYKGLPSESDACISSSHSYIGFQAVCQ